MRRGDVKPRPIRFFRNTRGRAVISKRKNLANFRNVKDRSLVLREWRKRKAADVKKKYWSKSDSGKGWKGIETVVSFRDSPVHLAEMVIQ